MLCSAVEFSFVLFLLYFLFLFISFPPRSFISLPLFSLSRLLFLSLSSFRCHHKLSFLCGFLRSIEVTTVKLFLLCE